MGHSGSCSGEGVLVYRGGEPMKQMLTRLGLTYVLVNLFTDVVCAWINSRMRG